MKYNILYYNTIYKLYSIFTLANYMSLEYCFLSVHSWSAHVHTCSHSVKIGNTLFLSLEMTLP